MVFLFLLALPAFAQDAVFVSKVYPALDAAGCRGCHNPDGVASPTRLQLPPEGTPEARIGAFGRSLVSLVDAASPEKSLLLTKPTKRVAHSGGERIKQGSPQESALRDWVKILASFTTAERSAALAYRVGGSAAKPVMELRRLTHSQYNNTVRDLLGDISAPANQFPPEDFINGFKNQAESQGISPILAEAYSAAAEKLATAAFRGGIDRRGLVTCKPSPECGQKFVASFGRRAFRRELSNEEKKRYAVLLRSEKDFMQGAQLVVEAMLQSSAFLFWRNEPASRLAYFLWNSTPDEKLLDEQLMTREDVERAARRMLGDARAHEAVDEFASQWLRFDRILTAVKDRRAFPQYSRETAVAMTEEARRFVGELVWNDRNFMELYTADYGFMNGDLANLYKVAAPQLEFAKVTFPVESERAGILGQALFLALTSKPDETSPTARGLFVREQFLCQKVPEPPPGVNANLPIPTEAKPMTNRERLAVHLSNESCASCHNLVDPIGFGLEKFDAIGGRREKLNQVFRPERKAKNQQPVSVMLELDTTGLVAGVPDSNFDSPRKLGEVLARTPQCQECVVRQMFRYMAGRLETPADRPQLDHAFEKFRGSQFKLKELMISLTWPMYSQSAFVFRGGASSAPLACRLWLRCSTRRAPPTPQERR